MQLHDIKLIREYMLPLIGQASWSVWLGIGSFISFEFGKPRQGKKRLHGEWTLWIQHASWRIDSSTTVVVGSEDQHDQIASGIKALEGRNITSIDVLYPSLELSIGFDEKIILRVFPVNTNDVTHWELFAPGNKSLVAGPGNSWSYQNIDEP